MNEADKKPRPEQFPFEVDDRITVKVRFEIAGAAGRLMLNSGEIKDKQLLAFAHMLANVDPDGEDERPE